MAQNLTVEQMNNLLKEKLVLGEPIKQSRTQVLEVVVQEKTPKYISKTPQYNRELMEAHLELAIIYYQEGNVTEAHSHFSNAEHEFSNMWAVETQKPKYIIKGKERQYFEPKEIKTQLIEYKNKLVKIANEIHYDALFLMLSTASDETNLIKKFV